MPEPNAPHIVTNGTTYVGPFNDRESAYSHLMMAGLTGWRVEPLSSPVLPG